MNDYSLSKSQLAELEQQHRTLRDKRQADRVKAVIALSKGWSAASIAEILLLDEKTSRNYFNCYQHGGLASLLEDDYTEADPKLTEQQIKALEAYLKDHILPDATHPQHNSIPAYGWIKTGQEKELKANCGRTRPI